MELEVDKIKLIQEAMKQAIANVILEDDCLIDIEILNDLDNLNELRNKVLIFK